MIGVWNLSGTVPTLVYYGIQVLSPSWYYAATALSCGVIALALGSSWTTAGTIGVGLIGVADMLGASPAITAGVVISGACLGDKLSPLSETTVVTAQLVKVDVYEHIKRQAGTFAPLNLLSLLPLGVLGAIPQPSVIRDFVSGTGKGLIESIKGVWLAVANGYSSNSGVAEIDQLLSRGDMASMLMKAWLIALVLPSRVFHLEFAKRGLAPTNLSRLAADSDRDLRTRPVELVRRVHGRGSRCTDAVLLAVCGLQLRQPRDERALWHHRLQDREGRAVAESETPV